MVVAAVVVWEARAAAAATRVTEGLRAGLRAGVGQMAAAEETRVAAEAVLEPDPVATAAGTGERAGLGANAEAGIGRDGSSRSKLADVRVVVARHAQHVHWRLRSNVPEGDNVVVGEHDVRGDLLRDYRAEQAVGHHVIISRRSRGYQRPI